MLIDALLKLHDQISDTKLGSNRKRQLEDLENAALIATPTSDQIGLMR
jgi:NADH-quinone oxidoreductase subunit B